MKNDDFDRLIDPQERWEAMSDRARALLLGADSPDPLGEQGEWEHMPASKRIDHLGGFDED